MAIMLAQLYEALRAANVPDDKAREAASEVAGFENRLAKLEADVGLLKWMVGFNLTLSLASLALIITIALRLH